MYEEEISQRLSELRIQKGFSARDMSLSIGQNAAYINHIENRQTYPSLPVFFAICEYFGISPVDFFSTQCKDPACISSIIEDLRRLNTEELHAVSIIIRNLAQKGMPMKPNFQRN